MPISTVLNTKIRLTMLCLSGFEVYSRWVPLMFACLLHLERVEPSIIQ